ncbi:MAG: hypothetical protein ABJH04_10640 [Cyclobacteriaceae bacterium]
MLRLFAIAQRSGNWLERLENQLKDFMLSLFKTGTTQADAFLRDVRLKNLYLY